MRWLALLLVLLALEAQPASAQTILRKGDAFELRLGGVPAETASEFQLPYSVDDDGKVSFPLVGEFTVVGLRTNELARAIERRLVEKKIFTTPTVVISLRNDTRFVTMGIGFKQPGIVPWSPDLTLSTAISRVQGPDDFHGLKKVQVTREGKALIFDLTKKSPPATFPTLLPGDEIQLR